MIIPAGIAEVVDSGPWSVLIPPRVARTGATWFTIWNRGSNTTVDVRYNRWRHTSARAYRGNALRAVLRGQQALIDFLDD